ncbi:MAG: hypothetical protein LBH06_02580 [Rikenellaceae bacterium]|jgi:hypothetical protein|nr:hypothetical protein [Rikenellaceae bacterium]
MKIFSTWICIDERGDDSWFPASGGLSSERRIQAIYWRALCVAFFSARLHNPDLRLVLFSNVAQLPEIDGISIERTLSRLGVELRTTPFEHRTPPGYYGHWRNQFYEFSIFEYIKTSPDFADDDLLLMVDSDCIITANLAPLYADIERFGAINCEIGYFTPRHIINGISRLDMMSIFEQLEGRAPCDIPKYYAGEFFAARVAQVAKIYDCFEQVWPQLLDRHSAGLPKFNEEAHTLSYIYWKLGLDNDNGGKYVKRMNTNPVVFRNTGPVDVQLPIWHLPLEKTTGLRRMFRLCARLGFDVQAIAPAAFNARAGAVCNVVRIPARNKIYFAAQFAKTAFGKFFRS